ncbi:MAG TPA: apolipoprotein N-acyltransferase [Bacteroidia bacterium]|nr:apolipoprotein N-acyltransferase [Bacteroidia bacterium]
MKAFSKPQLYLLSLLTGVLLWAAWPARGLPFILVFAFCPLLVVEEHFYRQGANFRAFKFFTYAYVAALSWNILSTWWVLNSTIVGGIAAIVLNALFMALVLVAFHYVRMKTNNITGYASFVILWIAFEYFHLNWQCSWPWLTLGNGFANHVEAVQWYEYTGVLGGSLWILVSNLLFFQLVKSLWLDVDGKAYRKKSIIMVIAIVVIPISISFIIAFSYNSKTADKKRYVQAVVVQPNIDPYNEKFSGDFKNQLDKMLALADTKVDSTTDYLIFPETALTDPDIWENNLEQNGSIQTLQKYLTKYPKLSIVTGASTWRNYNVGDNIPESARKYTGGDGFFDAYNTAFQLNNSSTLQLYHKSKLVPGVETMPFRKLLGPIADLAFSLGGTSGTLGTQKEPSVFYTPNGKNCVGTAICYESIYGEYIGQYVLKGAQLIFVITNDGWWGDTPGYKQHLAYARLRAIETRRSIARSANTGISEFIDEMGNVSEQTGWWVPAVIKTNLSLNRDITFYVKHGDYIGVLMSWLSAVLLVYVLGVIIKSKIV